MLFLSIAHDYFIWHYTRAFREIFSVWLNFLWFVGHFFSIPQLAKSWFSPFKRITEERRQGVSFEDIAGYVIINLFSRFVGAILRTVIILIGIFCLLGTITAGVLVYVLWIFLPVIIFGGLISGLGLLFA